MRVERIESRGLAHYSYLISDGNQAVVIDPRRDCEVYVQRAVRDNLRITHILETHRNEDYVVGSVELAARTGAPILHNSGGAFEYGYGEDIADSEKVRVGQLELRAIHTPGHTAGHMSYLLSTATGAPWMLFSGDALFAGDVGRVDLAGPDRTVPQARTLYDSVFRRLLPLGDEVLLYPAHGAGSACGAAIADRPWTTIGLERRLNPLLQVNTPDEFVQRVARVLDLPPYFNQMETLNREGAPLLGALPVPVALDPAEFERTAGQAQVVDVRSELGFATAHVPGALSIWEEGLAGWAGWFVSYTQPVLLVADVTDVSDVTRTLIRMGYDQCVGTLAGGQSAWLVAGRPSQGVRTVTVQELCRRLDAGEEPWILDVRSLDEVHQAAIPGAHHIHLPHLLESVGTVPRDRAVIIFCGSGRRSMVAASLLQRQGYEDLTVVLGGMAAWSSIACPLATH